MTTALITHPSCLLHEPPPGHPERPARLKAVLDALSGTEFSKLKRRSAPKANQRALSRVHAPAYVKTLLAQMPDSGYVQLDSDTAVSAGSKDAALRAAGAVIHAVDLVMKGEARNAFCAVRPPGHHALRARAMGFCLFNNVAVGALHARAEYGVKRMAVVDFDVHHGNGTQAAFMADPDVLYISTHQSPLYPGTGRADEPGIPPNIVNVPLPPGAGGALFRQAFEEKLLPELKRFKPELIFISAGFDAHRDDPMAQLRLEESDFAWVTQKVCALAARICQGRVVSTLEGGYDLASLAGSAKAHVKALMDA